MRASRDRPQRGGPRTGAPVELDGSRRSPLLLRLPPQLDGGRASACNNGCRACVCRPELGRDFAEDVSGKHVVLRDREPLLRRDLPALVAQLRRRHAASVRVVTNGRLLAYPRFAADLAGAGIDEFVVKLFAPGAPEHDAHTRVAGSYEQARRGIEAVRRTGGRALLTFPGGGAATVADDTAFRRLAAEWTGREPIDLPEPHADIDAAGGEPRWDVARARGRLSHPMWSSRRGFFPVALVSTGPACNVRCVYCNVRGGDDPGLVPREEVERAIDLAALHVAKGLRDDPGPPTLELLGGEPTLHPDLPALVARGREAGFEVVAISTNGTLLLRPGYLEALEAAGLTRVRLSLHDERPQVAGALAGAPAMGPRYADAARALLARPELETQFFRIALSGTIGTLTETVRFLASANRTGRPVELVLGLASMRGRMRDAPGLYPPLADLRPRMAEAVALGVRLGLDVLVHHAPGCLDPDAPERNVCWHVETTAAGMGADRGAAPFEGETAYARACERCTGVAGGCAGIPRAYWDRDAVEVESWVRPVAYVPATERAR